MIRDRLMHIRRTPTAAVWPALIINDQLNLSEYTGPQIPVSAVDNIQQPQTDVLPNIVISSTDTFRIKVCQTRDQLVSRLMQETRLQAVHATQCLENAGWIYDQAMASFRALQVINIKHHSFRASDAWQSMGGIPDSALVPMC